MASTPRTSQAKINKSWMKNVGKSVAFSSLNVLKSITPNITNTAVSVSDSLRDMRKFMTRTRAGLRMQERMMDNNSVGRTVKDIYESAINDIKTGNFSLDRISDETNESFDDIDLSSLDFGDESSSGTSDKSAAIIGKTVASTSSANIEAMKEMTNVLSKTQLKTAKLISDKNTDITLFGINRINTSLMGVNNRLDSINANLISMIQFQNENVSVTNQAMLQYFDKSLEILGRLDKSMDVNAGKKKSKNDFSDMFSGGFNMGTYGKYVKNNFNNSIVGAMANMGKMLFSMSSMMGPPRIAQMVLESVLKHAIPKGIRTSIGSLDKNFTRYAQAGLNRIGDLANDYTQNDIVRFLGEILGTKRTKVKSVNMGDYNKDALSWNGTAQKALTEVIPSYLAKIEQNTSKNRSASRYYDYEVGKFKTKSQIAKEYRGDREMYTQSGMSGSTDKLMKYLEGRNTDPEQIKGIQKRINKLINDRLRGKTKYDRQYRDNLTGAVGGSLSRSEFRDFVLRLEDDLESTMGRLNTHSSTIERNIEGSVYRNLFNTHGKSDKRYNSQRINSFGLRGVLGEYGGSADTSEFTAQLSQEVINARRAGASESEIRSLIDARNRTHGTRTNASRFIRNLFGSSPWASRGSRISNAVDGVNNELFDATMGFSSRGDMSSTSESDTNQRLRSNVRRRSRNSSGRATSRAIVNDNPVVSESDTNQRLRSNVRRRSNNPTVSRALRSFRGFSFRNTLSANTNDIESGVRDTNNLMASESDTNQRLRSNVRRRSRNSSGRATSRATSNVSIGADNDAAQAINDQSMSLKAMIVSLYNSFLRPMVSGLFGKDGLIKNMWGNSTAKKAFGFAKDKLFNEESGIFGGVTKQFKDAADYMKYVFTGKGYRSRSGKTYADKSEDSVFGYLKKGYQSAFSNTMKFLFNDDYKGNDWYKKYFSWADPSKKKKDDKKKQKKYTYANKNSSVSNRATTNSSTASPSVSSENVNSIAIPITSTSGRVINETYDTNDSEGIQNALQRNLATSTVNVSNRIQSTGNRLVTTMMGDPDQSDTDRERGFLKSFKSNMPKMLSAGVAGAGFSLLSGMKIGLLGGLFLPGGPIGSAIVGMGLQLLSRSTAFQKFMFGEYDPRENKKVGGIISQRMQNSFKRAIPFIVGGAVVGGLKSAILGGIGGTPFSTPLGVLTSTLLPGGIIGGALMGIATSLLINNQKFKQILFGQREEDGTRRNGIFAKAYNMFGHRDAKANKMFKGGFKGAGIGALTAFTIGKMGIIPAALTFGGPIGGAIAGLSIGIASQTKRFQELLFGSEEVGPDGRLTGKRNRDGILSQVRNMFVVRVIDPLKKKTSDTMTNFALWAKKQILFPFRLAFGPLADAIAGLKDSVGDVLKEKISNIATTVGSVLVKTIKSIFNPIAKIIGTIGRGLISTIATATKIALSPLTGFLKLMTFATRNLRKGERSGPAGLGWDKVGEEQKEHKALIKKTKKEQKKWNKIYNLRQKYAKEDKNKEFLWSPELLEKRQKKFIKLGIDADTISNERDTKDLIYRIDDWKDKYIDGNTSTNPNAAIMGNTESPEVSSARIRTTVHQNVVEDRLSRIVDVMEGRVPTAERIRTREAEETRDARSLGDSNVVSEAILSENVSNDDSDDNENGTQKSTKKGSLLKRITSGVGGVFSGIFGWLTSGKTLAKIGATMLVGSIFHKPIGAVMDKFVSPFLGNLFNNVLPKAIEGAGTFLEKNADKIGGFIKSTSELMSKVITTYGPAVITSVATNASAMMKYLIPGLAQVAGSALSAMLSVIKQKLGLGDDVKEKVITPEEASIAQAQGKNVRTGSDGELILPSSNTYYDQNNNAQTAGKESMLGKMGRLLTNSIIDPKTATTTAGTIARIASSPLKLFPGGNIARSAIIKGAEYTAGAGSSIVRGGLNALSNPKSIITGAKKTVAAYQLSRQLGASRFQSVVGIRSWLKQSGTSITSVENSSGRLSKWLTSFFAKLSSAMNSPTINNIMKEGEKAGSKINISSVFSKIQSVILKVVKAFDGPLAQKVLARLTNGAAATLGLAKGMSRFIPVLGQVLAGYDLLTGAFEADKLFGVDSDAVDWKMRMISSLMKAVLGTGPGPLVDILFTICSEYSGTDIKQEIATNIYDIFTGEEGMDRLATAKSNFAQEALNYNNKNETNLSTSKYNELKNAPWYKKAWNAVSGKGNEDFSKYEVGNYKSTVSTTIKKTTSYSGAGSNYSNEGSIGNGPGKKIRSKNAGYGLTKPIRMANFTQNDPRWARYNLGKMPDGSTSNMKIGGCGPTALSNVVSSVSGNTVSPLSVARFAKSRGYLTEGGSSKDLFESGASELGLKSNRINKNNLISALKSGKPVIVSGKGSSGRGPGSGASPFTSAGHIITASGLDKNGNTVVNDPLSGRPKVYNVNNLMSGMTNGWAFNKRNVGYGITDWMNNNPLIKKPDDLISMTKKLRDAGMPEGTSGDTLTDISDMNDSDSFSPIASLLGKMGQSTYKYIDSFMKGNRFEKADGSYTTVNYDGTSYDKTESPSAYVKKFGSTKAYIEALLPGAKELQRKYGILPSLTIGQAIHESAHGKSELASLYNNHFGVTAGDDWKGPTKSYYDKGMNKTYTYRVYSSPEESIRDYGKVLLNSRYNKVRATKNYKEAIIEVKKAGYAEDPKYVEKLTGVVESNGLAALNEGYGIGNTKNNSTGLSKMLNLTTSNSYQNDMESMSEGYGNTNDISQRLNVAVNTTGVENKLDILIQVMKTWAERDSKATNNTVNLYNKGNSNNTNNRTPAPSSQNKSSDSAPNNNLRSIHQMIASGIRK